ncbi:hypothetical protein [Reyranella sp.]|uniref:hypothetical protein n=1 Tax=Reyranella sp. TaxID=1929291 RepID=UPI003BAA3172
MVERAYVDELLETYVLSLAGLDQCPDIVADEVKSRLTANVERAEQAFAQAVADGLDGGTDGLRNAVRDLADANETVRSAFHTGRSIGDLLVDLERATAQAGRVLAAGRA